MKNKVLLIISTILIGSLFLFSGVAKGIDINSFGELLKAYGSPYFYFLAPVISGIEIFIGFSMLFFINPKKSAFVALFLTTLLTIIFAVGYLGFGIDDCGCFGSILRIPAYLSFIRNILIILLAWYVWRYYPEARPGVWRKVRLGIASLFAITSLTISSLEVRASYKESRIYLGQHVNTTILPHLVKSAPENPYLVFIFLPSCQHCQQAVAQVKNYKKVGLTDSIVGIYPSYVKASDIEHFVRTFGVDFPIKACKVDSIHLLSKKYPAVFGIKNDTIIYNFIGSVPSPRRL